MKTYPIIDLTGDKYLNPDWPSNRRALGTIQEIAVHHDAVARPHEYDSLVRYKKEAAEHYIRLGPGLQYHYKIDNTGTIFQIRPHSVFLYHCGDFAKNKISLAICVDGNFENQTPTREQFEALKQLLDNLSTKHPEFPAAQQNVWPHRHYKATACCGANLVGFVDSYRASHGAIAIPNVPFDWPSLQEPAPVPPPPPPAPLPPPPVDHTDTPPPVPEPIPAPVPDPVPTPEPVPAPIPPAPVPTPTPSKPKSVSLGEWIARIFYWLLGGKE